MTAAALAPEAARPVGIWRRHLIALGAVAMAILILFRSDVADLTHLWWTSTTFGHCLFITDRSEEHTSELQSLMRISYAVFCLKKKTTITTNCLHSTPTTT